MDAEAAAVRARLEGIGEELAELALASLRESLDTGEPAALARERRLTRARRAVLRAAALLGEDEDPER